MAADAGAAVRPLLVVLGGQPGVGKSTVAHRLARRRGALLLRIDVIEQAMRAAGVVDIGPAGYAVAQGLAAANLALGLPVVADAVNPVAAAREGWAIAAGTGAPILTVELVCADRDEHRRRVETRRADIAGLALPAWTAVLAGRYEPWPDVMLHIDTSAGNVDATVAAIEVAWDALVGPDRRALL